LVSGDKVSEQVPTKGLFKRACVYFTLWLAWLILLASLDIIDFHICVAGPGHCKIIDPTTHEAVPL
jgi:hypothetical protein